MSEKTHVAAASKKKVIVTIKKRKPELVDDWPLSELKDHPMQDVYFRKPTQAEVEKLAGNLQRNTQTDAVEITPGGVIISGHKRVLAARFLGWETIRVLVRYDLAGDDKAIERRLVEANEDRRHLTTFQRALLQYRMWQLRSPGDSRKARGQINDELSATLNKTVRQVSRYIQLFDGPAELLDAVKDGLLLPTHGFSVLKLSSDQMQPILDLLQRGDADRVEVRTMVKQTVAAGTPKKKDNPETLLNKLFKTAAELMGHASLKEHLTGGHLKSVAKLRRLLERLEGRSSPAA